MLLHELLRDIDLPAYAVRQDNRDLLNAEVLVYDCDTGTEYQARLVEVAGNQPKYITLFINAPTDDDGNHYIPADAQLIGLNPLSRNADPPQPKPRAQPSMRHEDLRELGYEAPLAQRYDNPNEPEHYTTLVLEFQSQNFCLWFEICKRCAAIVEDRRQHNWLHAQVGG